MDNVRLGPVGRLSVYRPVLTALLLALGLTAAVAAATRRDPGAAPMIGDILIASLALMATPFLATLLAPSRAIMRLAYAAALATALFGGAVGLKQLGGAVSVPEQGILWFSALAGALLVFGRAAGTSARLAAFSLLATALGAAGAMAFLSLQGTLGAPLNGPLVAAILALAALPSIGLAVEFADGFAAGLNGREAAGLAARHSAAPTVYFAFVAAAAFALAGAGAQDAGLQTASFALTAGLGVAAAGAPAFALSAGAFAARRHSERLAVGENRRRQAFRRFWRPFRSLYSPSASLAVIAIGSIVVIAALFETASRTPAFQYGAAFVAGLFAAIAFVSLRVGVFVFVLMLVSLAAVEWGWAGAGLPQLPAADAAAAMTVAAALFAQIALIWRNSRSPRLNARETTERAMALATPAFLLGAVVASSAFAAVHLAGYWDGAPLALLYAGVMAVIGAGLAPAAMTGLSQIAPRDLG